MNFSNYRAAADYTINTMYTTTKINRYLNQEGLSQFDQTWFLGLFYLTAGIILGQRFLLPTFSSMISVLILIIPVYFLIRTKEYTTLLLISSLAVVDLGAGIYTETPSLARNIINLILLSSLPFSIRYYKKKMNFFCLIYLLIITLNTVIHPNSIDQYTLVKDLVSLSLALLIIHSVQLKKDIEIAIPHILIFSYGLLASELLNMLFYYSVSKHGYLNFSSLKFIYLVPLVHLLCIRNYRSLFIQFPLIMSVVIASASRTLLLSGILIAFILVLRSASKNLFRTTVLLVSMIIIILSASSIEGFRALDVFTGTYLTDLSLYSLMLLDPVRYGENQSFFTQDFYHLIFGNGLGSGIRDISGTLSFVQDNGYTYTTAEIANSHFFRLHDSWIWFGYRFGLLAYVLFLIWGLKGCLNDNYKTAFFASCMLLALINASFSMGGMIVCSIFALHYKFSLDDLHEFDKVY